MRALDVNRPPFRQDLERYAPKGSPTYRAVMRVVGELGAAGATDLPGKGDVLVRLRAYVMARPVPGTNLAVAYVAAPDVLFVLAIVPLR